MSPECPPAGASCLQVYGPETETLVMEEDAQPLEVPIVKPVREVKLEVKQREAPPTLVSTE